MRTSNLVLRALAAILFALVGSTLLAQGPTPQPSQAQLDDFVRDVLRDQITTDQISGFNFANGRHLVSADQPDLGLSLSDEALPDIPGVDLALISLDAAQQEAARTGDRVNFVSVRVQLLEEQRGVVWVGRDFVFPPDSTPIKLCCCVRQLLYLLTEDGWQFERRLGEICS